MSAKKVIGFQSELYDSMKKAETEAMECVAELESLSKKVMGEDYKVKDYVAFIKDPYRYVVQEFKDKFYSHLPDHLNPELAFQRNVSVSDSDFSAVLKTYKLCLKALGVFAPEVTIEGLKPGVDKKKFNIYLDPAKKDEWDALEKFVEASEKLTEQSHTQLPIALIRFCPKLMFDRNGVVKPNPDSYSA